jgi:predicted KAP-like P-loop ATPase
MPEPNNWFSADRPIGTLCDDKLGRSSFAKGLGAAVRGWQGRDSLVIALYGAWGTGKSSIKNMMLDALRPGVGNVAPVMAQFNAWQFANREQLTEAFFEEIGVALGRGTAGSKKNRKQLLQRWKRYAAYLKAGAGAAEHLRNLLIGGLVVTAAIVGIAVTQAAKVVWIVAPLLVGLAALLAWSAKAAALVGSFIEPGVEIGRRSLEEVKLELAETLRRLTAPLLVVIDDVDRLVPAEVQELFQLIKANADFPNLVYLLLFDRTVVEKNIEKVLAVSGRDYLEKIVQAGFDVPRIERARIHRILFEGLEEMIRAESVSKRFDKHRWGNLFFGGLQAHFKTLRDVNRFLSTLSFHVSLFRSESSFEVNPVDLIGLEVLRHFHPEVYRAVASNKELLTNRIGRDDRSDEKRKGVLAIVNEAAEESRGLVREVMKQLFPPVEWALDGGGYGLDFDTSWYRELRVCSGDVFDRYFHLAIADDDISQAVLDRILANTGHREGLRAELIALKGRGLLPTALDRLEAYKEKIPLDHAESFVTALFDACDDLGHSRTGVFEISPIMHADRIIYWYLRREPDAARKRAVLEAAIGATDGISLPVDFVSLESSKQAEEKVPDNLLIDLEGVRVLQTLCVQKIESAAASGRLTTLPELPSILYRWKEWDGDVNPSAYARDLVKTPEGAILFLKGFLSRSMSHGMGDYVAREHWYIGLKSVEEFVPWEIIESVIQDVSIESLVAPDDRSAVEAFRRAAKRRRRGKPDYGAGYNVGRDDDDDWASSPD